MCREKVVTELGMSTQAEREHGVEQRERARKAEEAEAKAVSAHLFVPCAIVRELCHAFASWNRWSRQQSWVSFN
jgi:hypothetical protein